MTQTTAVATKPQQQSQLDIVLNSIDTLSQGIVQDLKGSGIEPGKFLATAKMGIQKSQQRDKLLTADRNSLYMAIKDAAQQGLMPDGKEGVLVVYNTTVKDAQGRESKVGIVSFQPMILGIVKLMRQSGEILDCNAYVVHEKDAFRFTLGVDKMPTHDPDWFGERGAPIGAWAYIKLTNGEVISRMLPKDKIQRVAAASKQPENYSPTDGQAWEEFWQKAALRNAAKFAPKTPKLEAALAKDEDEFDFTPRNPATALPPPAKGDTNQPPAAPASTRASAAVQKRAAEKQPPKAEPVQPKQAEPEQGNAIDADYVETDLEPPM